jgi:hypothetical protein
LLHRKKRLLLSANALFYCVFIHQFSPLTKDQQKHQTTTPTTTSHYSQAATAALAIYLCKKQGINMINSLSKVVFKLLFGKGCFAIFAGKNVVGAIILDLLWLGIPTFIQLAKQAPLYTRVNA